MRIIKFHYIIGGIYQYMRAYFYNGPSYLIVFFTGRCNLTCDHCLYSENLNKVAAKDELTLSDYEKLAKNNKHLMQLTCTGGEPFLRTDIAEIVELFYKHSNTRFVSLLTNGSMPDNVAKQAIRAAKNCPKAMIRVVISIDGTQDVHDKVRGKVGSWKKAIETYYKIKEIQKKHRNVALDISTVCSEQNIQNTDEWTTYVKENLNINNHCILYPRGNIVNKDLAPSPRAYFDISQKTEPKRRRKKYSIPIMSAMLVGLREIKESLVHFVLKNNYVPFQCSAGHKLIEIDETGQVFPCETLERFIKENNVKAINDVWMGNIKDYDYSLKKVLAGTKGRLIRNYIKKRECFCTFECAFTASVVFTPSNIISIMKYYYSLKKNKLNLQ